MESRFEGMIVNAESEDEVTMLPSETRPLSSHHCPHPTRHRVPDKEHFMRRRTLNSFTVTALLILLLPANLLHADDPPKPPDVVTGIKGETTIVYVPGIPVKIPDPVPFKGVIVRVLPLDGDKPVVEMKSDDMGKFKISLPAGDYRVKVVSPGARIIEPPLIKVTVKEGEVAEIKLLPFKHYGR